MLLYRAKEVKTLLVKEKNFENSTNSALRGIDEVTSVFSPDVNSNKQQNNQNSYKENFLKTIFLFHK